MGRDDSRRAAIAHEEEALVRAAHRAQERKVRRDDPRVIATQGYQERDGVGEAGMVRDDEKWPAARHAIGAVDDHAAGRALGDPRRAEMRPALAEHTVVLDEAPRDEMRGRAQEPASRRDAPSCCGADDRLGALARDDRGEL